MARKDFILNNNWKMEALSEYLIWTRCFKTDKDEYKDKLTVMNTLFDRLMGIRVYGQYKDDKLVGFDIIDAETIGTLEFVSVDEIHEYIINNHNSEVR